jgi:hypothetical protein
MEVPNQFVHMSYGSVGFWTLLLSKSSGYSHMVNNLWRFLQEELKDSVAFMNAGEAEARLESGQFKLNSSRVRIPDL